MSLATLSSYSREQLSDILRVLKAYKTGLVQIGHRAYLVDPKENAVVRARIEYPMGASLEDIRAFTLASMSTYFGDSPLSEDIIFEETPSLVGGIRIFVGDDMLDISFQKFAHQMKL